MFYSVGTVHSVCWGIASVSAGSDLFSTDEDASPWKSEPVVQPSAILDSAKPLISLSVIDEAPVEFRVFRTSIVL